MNYEKSLIELISSVNKIQPQLIMKNTTNADGDTQIELKANDKDVSICYHLTAPSNYFEFPGSEIGFYDFSRFKKFFDVYNKPNKDPKLSDTPALDCIINQESGLVSDILIKSTKYNSKISHRMARTDVLSKPVFNNINLPSVDTSMVFSDEEFKNLISMINTIEAESIKFSYQGNKCTVLLINQKTNNTYDMEYELDSECATNYELIIPTTGITQIPTGYGYAVRSCARGLWEFTQIREDEIKMKLYISKRS